MKTDINGVSTCPAGKEHYEKYYSELSGCWMVQYDYRAVDGVLFSAVAKSVEGARAKRDLWLITRVPK